MQGSSQLNDILANISDAVFILDDQLTVTYWNDAAERLLMKPRQEVLGQCLFDAFPQARGSVFELNYRKAIQEKIQLSFETYFDEAPYQNWYNVRVYPKEKGILVYFCVVTDKKLAEEQQSEKNKFLAALVNLSPDALYTYDIVERKNVYSNNGVRTILGYSSDEIKAMGDSLLSSLMHPEDYKRYVEVILPRYAVARDEERIVNQYRMRHRNGEWRYLESIEVIYLRNPDRSPRQVFGVIHDIHERILVEEKLRQSEFFFRESQRAAFIGSYKADFIRDFWDSSEVLDEIFGIDKNYHRSIQGWLDLVHPDDKGMMQQYLREEIIQQRKPFNKRYRIIRKANGEVRWVRGLGRSDFDAQGNLEFMIGTIQDVTERKESEEALQKTQKLESLGILAGGIAHDFNNLLAGMFGYVDLAKASIAKGNSEQAQKELDKAFDIFDRTKALTKQLLTFAKGGEPIRKPINLARLLEKSTQFALSGSNVLSEYDIDKDLWQCDCDDNQIGQVIDNIVINARQAMPLGGKIFVRAKNICMDSSHLKAGHKTGDYVRMSIEDQGIGMSREMLSKIFDPFYTTKSKGQGLGLATAYSIVNRHDGWIEVESELDRGSTFHIFLPACREAPATTFDQPVRIHTGCGKVLVMDDEEMLRETACSMLTDMGYEAVGAGDGREALDLFIRAYQAGDPFVLSILDLTIPNGVGGREIVQEMHRIDKTAKVIVASGYTDDPVIQHPEIYGFTSKIVKPFRRSELAELLIQNLKH